MLARIRKSMQERDQGFTLIELLVVMIIIGILAAIAIPVFLNQRTKAQNSATQADVSTVGKEVATWFVDSSADVVLTQDDTAYYIGGEKIGNKSDNVTLYVVDDTATAWSVCASNSQGDKAYTYSADAGLQALTSNTCGGTIAPTEGG